MALHPVARKHHFPEETPVPWVPIRRALEENEDWYRDLVEHSQDLLCVHDLEGRFLSVNPVPARLLGYSVEEAQRMRLQDVIDPQFRDQCDAYLREIERTGESRGLMAVVTRSGEQRIWEYHNTLRTEGVAAPIVRGIAHDVTERVRAAKALRDANEQLLKTTQEQERTLHELTLFRTLLDQSNDVIQVVDPETLRFLDVNERACVELGYSREELLSMTVFDIDRNIDESWRAWVRQQTQELGFAIMERVHRRKDGTTFPVEVNFRRVRLDREYGVAVTRNITARKQAEEAARATNEQLVKTAREQERMLRELTLFRTLLDQSNDAIQVIDPATRRFLDVNQKECVELGYSREELLSMTVLDIDPDADDSCRARMEQQLKESGFAIMERVHRRKDGTTFPVEVNLRRVRLDREYGVAVTRNITARKQAEGRLQEFERVVENLEDMIVVVNREYRYVLANRALLSYRGLTKEQIVGRFVGEVLNPGSFETVVKEKLDECFQGKVVNYERRDKYPEMGERDIAITYLPVEGPAGIDRVACIARDITERKRAEEALRESERRQRLALQVGKIGAFELELGSSRGTWTTEFGEIWGIPSGFTGDFGSFFSWELVHPEDRARIQEAFAQLAKSGEPGESEFRLIRPDGAMLWVRSRGLVIPDTAAGSLRVVGVMMDITERKRAEEALRQSEERFRVALKNSPIAVFNQDRDLRYTWMYNSQIPFSDSEHLGKTISELFDPSEAARLTEVRRRVLETGVGTRDEMQVTFGGRKQYLDSTIEPVLDAAGAVIGLTGSSMDVTELREASEALREAKKKLTEEKLYLEQEIDTELGFGEIIGQSKALHAVMEHVGKVAASDATVLLLGETGTGKELVARAVHRLSQRADRSFIKLNCAAIPSGLVESELFGNEKGAFTGAVSKKIGRIELADKGTLFLDEIGEIPLALQPKLLRVLQDQEFERLGGTQTLKVDFRLIAATNRDLAEVMRQNEFRSDLYYRLNVFPIRVPPLRERRDDIHLLVKHFVQKCARRMNKSIASIPTETMEALVEWEWPGNVRELENFIERSVILTQGSVLAAPLSELQPWNAEEKIADETLEATEREHILRALRESNGQIGGPRGAAMRLGLKRTTLQSKLKHLGINPRSGPKQH
jgi:formate hydrogenlyase transcriptional activator